MTASSGSTSIGGPSLYVDTEIELFLAGGHDGYFRQVNTAFAALLGREVNEINGRSLLEFVYPEDLAVIVAGIASLERGEREVMMEGRFQGAGGDLVHLQWVARPVSGSDTWWAAGRDTTEFHLLLSRHRDLRVRMDIAFGNTTVASWDLDLKTGDLIWDRYAAQLLGVPAAAVPATVADLANIVQSDSSQGLLAAMSELSKTGTVEVDLHLDLPSGPRYLSLRGKMLTRDRRDRPVRAIGLLLDVTAEKAMEQQMLRLVMSDPLTGVPNRRAFDQALRTEWRRCARAREPLSVLMVDVDDFKRFNDTFGHPIGDEALIRVARSLMDGLNRAGDVLARYGGEEFVVTLPGTHIEGALVVANRLVERIREVNVQQAPGWQITVSVGAASCLAGTETNTSDQLLTRADAALYKAKAAGKNCVYPAAELFTP